MPVSSTLGQVPHRTLKLIVQDRQIFGLDIEFQILRSLDAQQNTAEITIFGLAEDTRKHLQQGAKGVVVEFRAGYETPTGGDPPLIFLGRLREVSSQHQDADWITKISSGDGDGANAPISFSVGPGAALSDVIMRTVKELGVGIGNAKAAILGGGFLSGLGTTYPNGTVVHGRADHELDRILRSIGKTYSVQNGDVQILDNDRPTAHSAHVLNEANGLVGSPEMGAIKSAAGTQVRGSVKARSLLTAEIYPGRQVKIESAQVNGYFRVIRATYTGQFAGNDWYVDMEGTPVK